MELNAWTRQLHSLYSKAHSLYQDGNEDLDSYYSPADIDFLSSIGLKPINVFDFVEDFSDAGEPDWDTFLLIAAARRDFFLYEQHGVLSTEEIDSRDLPARDAELGGIRWLPRIIKKARCFLEGGLCRDIMYCCGGDRNFLTKHNIHPADFLRVVWASKGDDQKILDFVKTSRG